MDKFNTLWNINLNVSTRSMKGILMLFGPFARNNEAFYNPQITKVEVTIEGIPNQLYSQGMRTYQMWDEAKKYFAASPGSKRNPDVGTVAKDLALADVNLGEFLTSKFSLWLDPRTSNDDSLHGNGRRIENASEGITIQITKKAEATGALNIYLFVVMDAQFNIEDGRFVSAVYKPLAADGPFGDDMRTDRTWKIVFILDLLEGRYRGFFQYIVILCTTMRHNKTHQQRPWIWTDPEVYLLDPSERIHDYLRAFYHVFMGETTLYLIDDCSALTALTKKMDMLSKLAFSGCHAEQSVGVLTQKYSSVLKDLREQTRWVCLFHCKDRDSFEDYLRENDVIPSREQRALLRQQLAETKHAKVLLKTDQPVCCTVLSYVKQ